MSGYDDGYDDGYSDGFKTGSKDGIDTLLAVLEKTTNMDEVEKLLQKYGVYSNEYMRKNQ